MQGPSATISTNIVSPVAKTIAAAVQSRWFSVLIGALAVAFIATLIAATLVANSTLTPSIATQLRTGLGAALLIALTFYLIGSRIRIGEMQARALAWERSLESMQVGIALYDRDDRLINCNRAFRELYSEIAHLFVPRRAARRFGDRLLQGGAAGSDRWPDARGIPGGGAPSPRRLRSHRGCSPSGQSLAADD